MCGIFATLCASHVSSSPSAYLETRLKNRGPDHIGTEEIVLIAGEEPLHLSLVSTVLSLRGPELVKQPLINDESNYMLCWNGEAWRIADVVVSRNDGVAVLDALVAGSLQDRSEQGFIEALRSIQGPFAFAFFDKRRGRLYFGRDRLGRRSLLMQISPDTFRLASIADEPHEGWKEVEADGFYSLTLRSNLAETVSSLTRHQWAQDESLVGARGNLYFDQLVDVLLTCIDFERWRFQRFHSRRTSQAHAAIIICR